MKQAHRKAIVAALAAAGFLAGNVAFGAENANDYREYLTKEKRQRVEQNDRTQVHQGKRWKSRK